MAGKSGPQTSRNPRKRFVGGLALTGSDWFKRRSERWPDLTVAVGISIAIFELSRKGRNRGGKQIKQLDSDVRLDWEGPRRRLQHPIALQHSAP
jgi:hypothetical protein